MFDAIKNHLKSGKNIMKEKIVFFLDLMLSFYIEYIWSVNITLSLIKCFFAFCCIQKMSNFSEII